MPRKKATEEKPNEDGPKLSAADNINYVVPANEFPFVYANNAVLSVNDLDGSILFGEVVAKEGTQQHVVPKVKVIMATPFIRRLRDLLNGYPLDAVSNDLPKKD